jgi:hypothetical protein
VAKALLKDPMELSLHPLARQIPEWETDDPRFGALVEDIRERGLDKPLLIDREDRIVDGKMCWRAAKRLQLTELECRIVPDEQIAGTVVNSLLQRRHCTKGQLAYLVHPFLDIALDERKRNRLANLRKSPMFPEPDSIGFGRTIKGFVRELGFSEDTFEQAARVHEAFKNPKKFEWNDERRPLTLKEYYEPRILAADDAAGLGAVLAGIGAKLSPETTNQHKSGQLELFSEALATFKTRWGYWSNFDDGEKRAARLAIKLTARAMPADLREEWAKALKEAQ